MCKSLAPVKRIIPVLVSTTVVAAHAGVGQTGKTRQAGVPEGPGQVLYVGTGTECDHPGIQGALNTAMDGAEIRVTTGTYSSVDVHNEGSLTIIGGYASCVASEPTDRTILDGAGSDTVMDVLSSITPLELELENLTLRNGDSDSQSGGLHIEDQIGDQGHAVTLRSVFIENNTASDTGDGTGHGGGIRIESTNGVELFLREGSLVGSNTADNDGGGIHCDAGTGTPSRVVIGSGSAVQDNSGEFGGGIYAANCEVVSAAGGPFLGINLNQAGARGGGIYAEAGSQIELRGDTPGGGPFSPASVARWRRCDMRALVVYCHPKPDSFTAAVRNTVMDALEAAGAEARLIDLYAEDFEPCLNAAELDAYEDTTANAAPVQRHVALLQWCDTLIFVYPTWWYGLPARLKGWLDRVLLPGVAFLMPDAQHADIRPGLTHIDRLAVFTTCGASRWLTALIGAPGRRTILRGIRALCGNRCRTVFAAHYLMDRSTPESRAAHLARVAEKVQRLAGATPGRQKVAA